MTSEATLKDLISKRGAIKGRVTKFKTHLDTLLNLETCSPIDVNKLVMKLARIEALFGEFDELQKLIEIQPEANQANELTARDLIEQDFDNCVALAQNFIQIHSAPPKNIENDNNSCCSHHHDNHDRPGFKLPIINIPKFDGTYSKWLEFKEIYCSLIHDNSTIKNVHKFHYLGSYLEGEAARVLSNLEISDKNYNEAWSILCSRYDDKRQLINNHLKSLLQIESVRETEKSIRFLIDHVNQNLRALSTLGLPTDKWDALIIAILVEKLGNGTTFKWEEHKNTLPLIPTLEDFFSYLKNRANILETFNHHKSDKDKIKQTSNNNKQTKSFVATSKDHTISKGKIECFVCKGNHRLYECTTFKEKTPEDRNSVVSTFNLCVNCLRPGHNVQACKLPGACRQCKQKHNTLLHVSNNTTSISMSAFSTPEILLCTAKVRLINPHTNASITIRALLDSGSQSSFITERVKQRLKLTPQPSNVGIVGIGNSPLKLSTERCALQLQSTAHTSNTFVASLFCLVLKNITENLPKLPIDISQLNLSDYDLADPSFYEPSPIDMLIGADLFWELIGNKQHSIGTSKTHLRSSKLGWLIAGRMPHSTQSLDPKPTIRNFLLQEDQRIDQQLAKFWDLENVPQAQPYTEEENLCEKHFLSNTSRESDGRFSVGLPLKDNIDCLGESYYIAKKRFYSLESRFRKNPELKVLYSQFIKEYADCGHLSESSSSKPPNSYFLPHHPVFRDKSESTKLRVVFNASEPTTSGLSVNNLQMVGPTVQDSLFNILLRFRQYKYVLSGDIEKMYRQVRLRQSDRDLQLILWRDNEDEPLRTLRLNTVTYGFASASFLTTRCIWQIGEESVDHEIKTIIQRDFYCDDLLTGADTSTELRYIQQSIATELAKGCFPLRKYRSNLPNLIDNNCINNEKSNLIISNATSTLGVGWSPTTDDIHFPINYSDNDNHKCTKRTILSTTFKIFDPLGLISLCTIKAKIFLQMLWLKKLDWDEQVPRDILDPWEKFTKHINILSSLKIKRKVLIDDPSSVELHCFCDASQQAYGSCIYLRSEDRTGNIHVSLLCAKARVAPTKIQTIPKLELCGTLLGAELTSAVSNALSCKINRKIYWTDSNVVLGWLKSPNKLKTFVANRVAAISELTDTTAWRHVPTAENPADLASRGVDPQYVHQADLWWSGPPFLKQPESSWPVLNINLDKNLPEIKAMPVVQYIEDKSIPNFQQFSKLSSLQRVYATVFRFIHNCKHPTNKVTGILQVQELKKALTVLIKIAQGQSFSKEIMLLQSNKPLKANISICSLNPFLDDEKILRVGGRIEKSSYSYDKKHPIILKAEHCLTKLIFQTEHLRLLHSGPQSLLASIRELYWPLGGRKLARNVVRNCFICRRFKGETMSNIMGNLPTDRIEPDFPFSTVGTDFAGPFLITDRKGRGCKITKCYLCIFVCLRYKCLHLEVVSDLTKDAFIQTVSRFIARRGMPKVIYCDNGTNFVAAAKEIGSFIKTNTENIKDFAARRGIEFRFSPAYAPHFNGLAEAGVKSAKFHLRRILGQSHLTFEELTTVFAQIEAILNSRPLCPLSPSPNDFQPLTPAHFLIGRSLTSLPTPSIVDSNVHHLNRYQRVEQARQHFWKRWASEYISELQQRTKWRVKGKELQLDDLVLIKEDQTPPLCWRLGRVSKLFHGSDGISRVADVSTAKGTVRRALNRLCLLPTSEG